MAARWLTWAGLVILAASPAALSGRELPEWPVHRMCGEAEGILAGERIGATTVRIDEWLRPPAAEVPPAGGQIDIAGLDEHSRLLGAVQNAGPRGRGGRSMLRSQRLICFVERKGVAWYALGAVRDGSAGLIWLEGGLCYRYRPREQRGGFWPAGWSLEVAPDCRSEPVLHETIARGLADRRDWDRALEISHPAEQAIVLTSYLLARRSPEGEEETYRGKARQVLPKLGEAGVREIVLLMQSAQAGDDLGPAVAVLGDFGMEARPALPHVRALLAHPAQADPALVLGALGRIGDAGAAPAVLPFLAHRSLPVRAAAANALAAFQYRDAAGDIAGGLPAGVEQGDAWYVYVMLSALKDLDGAQAAACARKYIDQPAMVNVRDLLEPLLAD